MITFLLENKKKKKMEILTEERSKIRSRSDSIYKKRMSLFSISISRVYSQ